MKEAVSSCSPAPVVVSKVSRSLPGFRSLAGAYGALTASPSWEEGSSGSSDYSAEGDAFGDDARSKGLRALPSLRRPP
jgi:hypothetical protein